MAKRVLLAAMALGALSACQEQAPQPKNEAAPVAAETPAAPIEAAPSNAAAPAGDLAAWLVGTWAFSGECSTDLVVTYEADGKLDNSGNHGSWKLDGDTITETVTERTEMEGETVKLNPPEQLRYTVARTGDKDGVLTINGRKVPIRRC
ncbi:hypothetical protein P1X14_14535 [Sphingomonas sp. AOB5]|uniref:hypothetical protein n=1 Tax=Sphingomonas sp. AOB5 TaxID=3034017 RepID=UPI0023FA1DFB|nr:hypothetical protein [Sphingomonas sp. AOB5]MDF7776469.1 hypothetical protein [Sphingomonas sp. AOB5]